MSAPRSARGVLRALPALVALGAAPARAQYAGPTAEAQRRGREIVQAAIRALGDDHGALGRATVRLRGRTHLAAIGQGWSGVDTEEPLPTAGRVAFDLPAGRALSEGDAPYHGGYLFEQRTVIDGAAGTSVNVTAIGPGPYVSALPAASVPLTRASVAWTLPQHLLADLAARPQALRHLGTVAGAQGRPVDLVTYAWTNGAQITLHFDSATHLLERYESVRDDPIVGDAVVTTAFPGWRTIALPGAADSVRVPVARQLLVNGRLLRDDAYEVLPGVAPVASELAAPAPSPAAPAPEPARRLADGVYLLPSLQGAWNALLVEFRDFGVLVEAPGNSEAGEEALQRARTVLGTKPLRWVVATHHHADHIGGLRPVVADGIPVLTTAAGAAAIRRLAQVPRTLRPDRLARAPRTPTLEVVQGVRRITDGTRTLELRDVGPTAHAREHLLAWVPDARVVFQADLLILPDSGTTRPIAVNADLARALAAHRIPADVIVGVHGRAGSAAELRAMLGATPAPRADAR